MAEQATAQVTEEENQQEEKQPVIVGNYTPADETGEGIPRIDFERVVPEAVEDTSVLEVTADKTSTKPVLEQLKTPEGVAKLASSLAGDVGIKTRLRTIPLREEAAQDIEAQVTPPTLEAKMQEAQKNGKTIIAGQEYDADELQFLMEDEQSKADLQAEMEFMDDRGGSTIGVRPFQRYGEFYTSKDGEDASVTEVKEKTQQYLKDIDDTLRPVIPEDDLRDIIARNMGRGVVDVTAEKLAETARGTVMGVPYIAGLGYHATGAMFDSFSRNTSFLDEFAARSPAMEGFFSKAEDFVEKAPFGIFEGVTVGRAANDAIRNLLREEVENGNMTEDRFLELNFVYDENQDAVVEREFLSDQDAQDLLNLAYNDLNFLGKIVATGSDVGAGYMSWSTSVANKSAKLTAQTRQRYADYADEVDRKLAADGKPPMTRTTSVADMAIELETNYNAKKIDRKLLGMGIYMENKTARLKMLEDQAVEARANFNRIDSEVDPGGMARIGFDSGAPLSWKRAKAAKDNAEATYLRAKLGSVVNPIVADGLKTWGITTLAQYTGREFLSGEGGLVEDPQLAEFLSASVAYAVGLPVASKVSGAVKSGASELLTIPGSTRNPNFIASSMDFIFFGKGGVLADRTLSDYEKLVFYPKNGRMMNRDEKAGLRAIIRMYRDSTQEARDKFFEHAKAYQNMIDDNMAFFRRVAPGQAGEIEKNLHTAFYHIGDMSRLAALGKNASMSLSLDDLSRNPTLDDISNYMSDKATALAEQSIAVLEGIFASNNITGMQADALIESLNSGVRRYKSMQAEDAVRLKQYLDEAVSMYGKSTSDNVGENLLENIARINESLAVHIGAGFDEAETILDAAQQITANITERSVSLAAMDKGPEHMAAVARNLEDVIDTRDALLVARSREIYKPVREYFKTAPSIDLSNFVREFVVEAGAEGSISRFFSPQGAFFKGAEGRKIARSFEDMVNRVYGKDTIKELKKALIDSGVSAVEVQNMSTLQVALRAEEAGGSSVFSAVNGEELDYMIRQMKVYSSTTKNESLAAMATNIEARLDDILFNQDRQGYDILQEARRKYRIERGEAQRKGGLTDTIKSQREGPQKLSASDRDASKYTIPLGKDNVMQVLEKEVTQHITNLMYQDTSASAYLNSRSQIRNVVESIETEFGMRNGPNGRSYFDLDKNDGGLGSRQQLAALQAAIQASIEATYGLGESRKLNNSLSSSTRVGATTVPEAVAEFDFSRLTNVLQLEDNMMIMVKQGDNFYEVPLVNMDEVYEYAYNLEELYARNKNLAKSYDDGLNKFKTFASSEVAQKNLASAELSRDAYSKLQSVFPEITNADDVYSKMILSEGVDVTDIILEMSEAMRIANPNVDASEFGKLADEYLKVTLMRGLLNRAGVQPSDSQIPRFNKETNKIEYVNPRVATSPLTPLDDIQKNYEKFVSIFGEEHTRALSSIFTMFAQMNKKTANLKGRQDPAVNIRNMLGKAYNIARGQVGFGYTIGDLAVRIAEDARIDLYRMIATNEDAAVLTAQILSGMPLKKTELERLGQDMMNFVVTEIAAANQDVSYYVDRASEKLKAEEEQNDEQE